MVGGQACVNTREKLEVFIQQLRAMADEAWPK
jgi:hypothetical protein